ncbi:hypothetical protein MSAN_02132500 [Mycena sanguinolenta]|uniref:Uncharacterized protein n=1 Tax=Mycena sanguinolenta TaxID=230812 RepID=A0A8H6XHM7_9AGAR|nr:hypothetical protein MSAN_02132500 [Mycena sanguinolenta]
MHDQFHPDPAFAHSATCDPESPSGMFSRSRNFTVTGQNLTNITNNYTSVPRLPADFRMIPMGDIDLRREIRVDQLTGVANCPRQRTCIRRMHSAKARIDGRESKVTVAVYQGNGAQEEWRRDIGNHANIIQICGAATSNGINATLFNDDLIPVRHILDHYRNSHFSTVYIYACCNIDFTRVHDYVLLKIFVVSKAAGGFGVGKVRSVGRGCALDPVGARAAIQY